jgi:hypothetical protein
VVGKPKCNSKMTLMPCLHAARGEELVRGVLHRAIPLVLWPTRIEDHVVYTMWCTPTTVCRVMRLMGKFLKCVREDPLNHWPSFWAVSQTIGSHTLMPNLMPGPITAFWLTLQWSQAHSRVSRVRSGPKAKHGVS